MNLDRKTLASLSNSDDHILTGDILTGLVALSLEKDRQRSVLECKVTNLVSPNLANERQSRHIHIRYKSRGGGGGGEAEGGWGEARGGGGGGEEEEREKESERERERERDAHAHTRTHTQNSREEQVQAGPLRQGREERGGGEGG